jgi:type II secretory pathway component GspD/PulD (secretin)
LIRKQERKVVSGVPILKDAPVVGPLFRRETETEVDSEIIVMMTPRIVRRGDRSGAGSAPAERRVRPPGRVEILPHEGGRSLMPVFRPRPYEADEERR